VRYFLTGRLPDVTSILLVESGTRGLLEGVIPGLRQAWGEEIPIDLVTCYATLPKGFEPHNTRVYRVGDYRGRAARGRLYRELAANRYALVGIVCSGEIVLAKWKWVLALRIPAKLFIINENADYFWLDRKHLGADEVDSSAVERYIRSRRRAGKLRKGDAAALARMLRLLSGRTSASIPPGVASLMKPLYPSAPVLLLRHQANLRVAVQLKPNHRK